MSFIRMIIGLPLIIVAAVFAFVNNDMAVFSLWPFNVEITASLSVAIVFFLVAGYIIGKLDSWLSYSPLRSALRSQQRQNRKLSREQQALAGKVESLKGDLQNAKAKAEAVISVFQAGLMAADTAQKELKRLADETGMFGSMTDEEIASNAGKTYQDVTALRDPLAGLGIGE